MRQMPHIWGTPLKKGQTGNPAYRCSSQSGKTIARKESHQRHIQTQHVNDSNTILSMKTRFKNLY